MDNEKNHITYNALIVNTFLGYCEHGQFTIDITFKTCSSSNPEKFYGYALDTYSKEEGKRIGTAYGLEFITRILKTIGASNWESLKGKYVRIKIEKRASNLNNRIIAIGHIVENKWFYPDTDLEKFQKKILNE